MAPHPTRPLQKVLGDMVAPASSTGAAPADQRRQAPSRPPGRGLNAKAGALAVIHLHAAEYWHERQAQPRTG